MKQPYFFLLLLVLGAKANSQPWLQNLPVNKAENELTLFDYQHAFETYFAGHSIARNHEEENEVKESRDGWMQFKRWEYSLHGLVNTITGAFPRKTAEEVSQEYFQQHPHIRSGIAADWTSLGPDYSHGGYSGIGRLNCVAFHPTSVNTYWVGAAAGGLWVTHTSGSTWNCLTDQNGVLAVSDIAIPANYDSSHIIYIATGDREIWDNRSIGVLKSTDGGNTWNATGLHFTIYDNAMVNRLLMDPNNDQVLLAATSRGVYKTEDGGETWDHQLTSTEYIDMEYKPGDFNVISGSTKYGQIYYSDDGGNTWSRPFNDPAARRIELAVSPAQPDWVYALAASDDAGLYGVFKSIDHGVNYTQVFYRDSANLLTWAADGNDWGGQGWYDLCLTVSPTNANSLLLGGVNTWRSLDGGLTWSIVSHWAGEQVQAVHADKHSIRYRYNGDVFECNDGGIYLSRNNGNSWIDKSNGIVIGQMYRLGVSQTVRGDIITGLQDNGTKSLSIGNWQDVVGGDGMECLIDYTNADIQYGTLYYGSLFRTDDHWGGSIEVTPFEAGDGAWITPYVIDPVDPSVLYGGFTEIWKTADKGVTWNQLTSFGGSSLFESMAIAPSDHHVLYAATASTIFRSPDGGINWDTITYNLPAYLGHIESIAVKHDDPYTVWVALSGFSSPGVFQYSITDSTWTSISAGLPPIPVYSVIENRQSGDELQLFTGTELGIYLKKGNDDWVPYMQGLPNVRIGELDIYYDNHPQESRLRAATYGRGLWETPVPTAPVGGVANTLSPACLDQSGLLQLTDYFGDIQWQQSTDSLTGWENVMDGNGIHEQEYTTMPLNLTTYYRAEVTRPEFAPAYSTIAIVPIVPLPGDAGTITGKQIVCQGDHGEVYAIDSIEHATSYEWVLPSGISGTSTSDSILLSFDEALGMTEIQVKGVNENCEGVPSSLMITVNPKPQAPVADTIEQPDCEHSTGAISFLNLPGWGPWELINEMDSSLIHGEGNAYSLADLLPGEYIYIVRDALGCLSDGSDPLVINSQPLTPPAPVITDQGFELHSDAPMGNQWYNENGIIPGATEPDYTATEAGHYYVIVTLNGCSSPPSNIIELFNEGIGVGPLESRVSVIPNPVKGEMNIKISGNALPGQYEVWNAYGEKLKEGTFVERVRIESGSFPSGLYLISVSLGGEWVMKKVIKQ